MPHTMHDSFHGIQLLPESSPPKQLYILLHGEGATSADVLSLAKRLQDHYPDAAFLLPDGFRAVEGSDYRRQWYRTTIACKGAMAAAIRAGRLSSTPLGACFAHPTAPAPPPPPPVPPR